MYCKKAELINRLTAITGKSRSYFTSKSVTELNEMLEVYENRGERIYLEVPYKDKEIVKLLGAEYDGNLKKWYIPQGVKQEIFYKWVPKRD